VRGDPQLEQQAPQAEVVPIPAEPITLPPAAAPEVAMPAGGRVSDGLGGMRDVLGLSTPDARRRFVLQLQRTAGNAAVCRWLGIARARHAARGTPGDDPLEPDDLAAPPDDPDGPSPDEGGPRRR
jgi:hypothetical protein